MVGQRILTSVKNYIAAVASRGVVVERAVIFRLKSKLNLLWRVAARIDSRIEPIPCGSRHWRDDDSSAIIEIARREGEMLEAA